MPAKPRTSLIAIISAMLAAIALFETQFDFHSIRDSLLIPGHLFTK